jgi:hypothetical protein
MRIAHSYEFSFTILNLLGRRFHRGRDVDVGIICGVQRAFGVYVVVTVALD